MSPITRGNDLHSRGASLVSFYYMPLKMIKKAHKRFQAIFFLLLLCLGIDLSFRGHAIKNVNGFTGNYAASPVQNSCVGDRKRCPRVRGLFERLLISRTDLFNTCTCVETCTCFISLKKTSLNSN